MSSCSVYAVQSYRDFHQDLFPDTFDGLPLLTSKEWFDGKLATWVCNVLDLRSRVFSIFKCLVITYKYIFSLPE